MHDATNSCNSRFKSLFSRLGINGHLGTSSRFRYGIWGRFQEMRVKIFFLALVAPPALGYRRVGRAIRHETFSLFIEVLHVT